MQLPHTLWWAAACLGGCLLGVVTGANNKFDGKSAGVLHDSASGSLWSAVNENCCGNAELSNRPLSAAAVCIGLTLAVTVASLLTPGDCSLLVTTDDFVLHKKPQSAFIGCNSWWWLHSNDKTSANREDRECDVRLLLTCSALCRCMEELSVHLYTAACPCSWPSFTLAAGIQLTAGDGDVYSDNNNTKKLNSHSKTRQYHISLKKCPYTQKAQTFWALRRIRSAIINDMAKAVASYLMSSRLDYANFPAFWQHTEKH